MKGLVKKRRSKDVVDEAAFRGQNTTFWEKFLQFSRIFREQSQKILPFGPYNLLPCPKISRYSPASQNPQKFEFHIPIILQ
jgi:hypothetical protein